MFEGEQTPLWEQITSQWISSIKAVIKLLKEK